MDKWLDGKVAIITGAARGQGEAEARLFAEAGARVILADVLDRDGQRVADEIGEAAEYRHLDVSSEQAWADLMADVEKTWGRLDVLVNNAGVLHFATTEETGLDDYMRVININQVGVFLGMRAVIPLMKKAGGGSIVNISSTAGLSGMSGTAAYTASKFAVRGMTKTAAMELGRHGIRVNSVHPGGIDTPMVQDEHGNTNTEFYQYLPIPRIGQPQEVARMVLFLASDQASFSTGSEFVVDGGFTQGTVYV